MRISERISHAGTGVGRTVKTSKVAHNPAPSTERGKRRAARREAARKVVHAETTTDNE